MGTPQVDIIVGPQNMASFSDLCIITATPTQIRAQLLKVKQIRSRL